MAKKSGKWIAFIMHNGHYEWNVMPFGLKNTPQIFQRKMDNIFRNDEFIVTYIDDILIFSKNLREHIEHLLIFLIRVNEMVLYYQKRK